MKLDFTSDGKIGFERMVIGDGAGGANMSSIVLGFTNGAVMIKTCSDPPVWMKARDGHGLVIESPRSELRMSAEIDGRAPYILVEGV